MEMGEIAGGTMALEEGCGTPRHSGSKIPAAWACPPAPKKRPAHVKQKEPPKNGYFHPPDLEVFFARAPMTRREACA
ncbi:hypothetical protein CJ030_MR3G014739 [Morella rubra]|uniref:Cyclin-dependent protein kinase inhibitor SMR4 n=1 Tax=Morella rubra TaxID=262757 RepID=A0A6A1VY35_9ROSI|nr:hypothetical protein CJ030_MR3G014739 [Morella rubra]